MPTAFLFDISWSLLVMFIILIGMPLTAIFSIPIVMILTHHRRKMEELSQRRQTLTSEKIQAEFAAVRAEIQSLRDTTLQYDLSFDSNLQQMEHRLAHLERTTRNPIGETTPQNIYTGGR